jgi:O-antigen/teichoic acid export membrane protein
LTVSLRERIKTRLDPQTRGFARDSSKLAMGSLVALAGYAAQTALITHFLGLTEFGVFAIVVSTVDLVGRLLDFQVGQMTQAFAAETYKSDARRTVGIAQFSYGIDLGAGLAGFLVVAAIAPIAAPRLLDGEYGAGIFVLYALTMLATTTETTSIALLQLSGRFGSIFRLTLVREVLRFSLVLAALLTTDSLVAVVLVLVAMEAFMAVLWTASASRAMRERLGGASLWQLSLSATKGIRREMAGTVFHTNVISYVKIFASQAPTLLVGAMRTPAEAGAFKIGMAIAAVVGKPADPAWAAVLPRFAKLRAAGRRDEITALIRETSVAALIGMSLLGAAAIVFRDPLLRLFGGQEALAAAPVLVLGVLARIVNGALFWNSPLLYALKRAGTASTVFVGASVPFIPVLILCIDRWGATGAAAALLFWSVVVNAGLSVAAIRALRGMAPAPLTSSPQPG